MALFETRSSALSMLEAASRRRLECSHASSDVLDSLYAHVVREGQQANDQAGKTVGAAP